MKAINMAGILFLVAILASLSLSFLWGFTFSQMWTWFVIPVYEIPSISMWQFAGLVFFVRTIKDYLVDDYSLPEKSDETILDELAKRFLMPLLIVVIAWLLHETIIRLG